MAIFAATLTLGLRASPADAAPNPVGDQIAALTEDQRRQIFARMLQREGERCPSVTRTFYQGAADDGAVFWSIACSGGTSWQIMVTSSPKVDVKRVECAMVRALRGTPCFARFR